jgi:hypothetical protein
VKIVVEEGRDQSAGDPSKQQNRNEYEVDLDYEGALSLMRRLRSSGSHVHFVAPDYRIDFRLDPDEPIEVEIMSMVDEFWATSQVSDSQAESIIGVAYGGERFSSVIPGTEDEWDAWSNLT